MLRRIVLVMALVGLFFTAAPTHADQPVVHTVEPGENLFRIGLRYGVTPQQIASANRLGDGAQIYAGQKLVIPAPGAAQAPTYSPAASPQSYHVVNEGENLFRIALKYGVSVQALAAANALGSVATVYAGQRLVIPSSSVPRATSGGAARTALLRVPLLAQAHSLTCEAAATRMVAAYLGKPATEPWIQAKFSQSQNPHRGFRGNIDAPFGGTVHYGVYAEPVAAALRALGLTARVSYGTSYADIRAALDSGRPVIVWLSQFASPGYFDQPGGYRLVPGEHSYVVVGYDDKGLVVNDPLNGGRQFHIRAIPHWELFNNMAVIAGKE